MAKKEQPTSYRDLESDRSKPIILLDGTSVEFPKGWSAEARYQWRLHRKLLPPKPEKPKPTKRLRRA